MYTEPKIFTSNDLKKRSYIIFYLYGKRIRIYNGHCLGKKINPNYSTTIDDRHRLLNELLFEIKTALKNNTFKVEKSEDIKPTPKPSPSTFGLLTEALNKKLQSDLSISYKTDLQGIYNHFIEFLSEEEKAGEIGSISLPRIEEFLSMYSSSGIYYMNKRRTPGVLFSSIGKSLQIPLNVIRETETRRTKASLHKIYDKKQMRENPFDLMVVDVFADTFKEDLNSAQAVRKYFKPFKLLAETYGCTILFIHHLSKRGESGNPSKLNVLGSGAIEQALRCVLEL